MSYSLLLLDIDGTLRPSGQPVIPRENVAAVRRLQKAGVKVVIATGRGRANVRKEMLNGLKPDYWLCAAGAQVEDAAGEALYHARMTPEEMYALVDFFEDYEYPLRFIYSDASYVYVEYEEFMRWEARASVDNNLKDGEDQDRHLIDMPFIAFGILPREAAERFQEKYGHLGLRFVYSGPNGCDILPRGVDKVNGFEKLLEATGLTAADCVAVGDGDNDAGLLTAAGLGVAMANGTEKARAAADRVGPGAAPHGVADLCRELWPEVFADG